MVLLIEVKNIRLNYKKGIYNIKLNCRWTNRKEWKYHVQEERKTDKGKESPHYESGDA